nr:PqqD family protein [Sphingomonas sp.]
MAVYQRAVDLMEADLGDELVALDPNAGECFGFNSVATSVWRQLAEPRSFEQLRDALLEEYQVEREQCAMELRELLANLAEQGLVTSTTLPAGTHGGGGHSN